MIARFLAWWRRPPLRQRILNALSETEWLRAIDICKGVTAPFYYGKTIILLFDLEREGLVTRKPNPANDRLSLFRKTRQ